MAKLQSMPAEAIISGFKGVIDFYYWMGIPCARRWPRHPDRQPSEAERAQQVLFSQAAKLASQLSPTIRDFYSHNAAGTNMTWKDLFFRSYLSGLPTEVYQGEDEGA